MAKSDAAQNKAAFDMLCTHKGEIEGELGVPLSWDRGEKCKASTVSYKLKDVSVTNEADWPRMAKFLAEWSDKLCNVILPYFSER